MHRKIYLEVKMTMIIRADTDAELDDIMSGLEVTSGTDKADVELADVETYEVIDSK